MSRNKTRMLIGGISVAAMATTLTVSDWSAPMPSIATPALAGDGQGEGGEAGEGGTVSQDAAVTFALGLRGIEAELNAGWAAYASGDKIGGTRHFKTVHNILMGEQGMALEEEGLEREHMAGEVEGLVMTAEDPDGTMEDVRDLYEHGLHEVDEHIVGIEPLERRSAGFAKAVILGELAEASANFRKAARDGDQAAARLALAYAKLARVEYGRNATAFMDADGGRAGKAIGALDLVIALAGGDDAGAFLSAVSRAELSLSRF